jgi:hypothetical protein
LKPKIIIIEIPHSLFDKYYSNKFDLKINENENTKFKFLKLDIFLLLEYSYTKKNFLFLINYFKNNINSPDQYVELFFDGSMNLSPNIKANYNYENNNKDALTLAKSEANKLFQMDENIYIKLYDLLEYFSKKSKVYLLEVPANTIFNDISYLNNENYIIIENKINNLAKKNIRVIGSFHNTKTGCTDKDYITVNHPDINCLKKLFSNF